MDIINLGRSGGNNRPMSNNEAEQHGVDILNKGAGLIDKMRGDKRNWNNDQISSQKTQERRNVHC